MFAWSQALRGQSNAPRVPPSSAPCCCCNYGNLSFKAALCILSVISSIFATVELIDGVYVVWIAIGLEPSESKTTLLCVGIPQVIIEILRIVSLFFLLRVHRHISEAEPGNTTGQFLGFIRFMMLFSSIAVLFRWAYVGIGFMNFIGVWLTLDLILSIHTLCVVHSFQRYTEWLVTPAGRASRSVEKRGSTTNAHDHQFEELIAHGGSTA